MDREMLANAADLGEIIRLQNEAVERLRAYRTTRPYLMPPNLAGMLEGNLKDNIEVLYRELNNLTKPRSEQKQYVCTQCHSVFLQRLPGGICDECRARSAPGSGRYGGGGGSIGTAYDSRDESPGAADTPLLGTASLAAGSEFADAAKPEKSVNAKAAASDADSASDKSGIEEVKEEVTEESPDEVTSEPRGSGAKEELPTGR